MAHSTDQGGTAASGTTTEALGAPTEAAPPVPDDARPPALVRLTLALEQNAALDPAVAAVEPMAQALVAGEARRRVLHGHALGHAAHPLLTDLPLGAWMSATVLDLTGGSRGAAARLVGLGALTAVPTAVTGWAEWAVAEQGAKRVGVVHAGANSVALGLYTGSWLLRRRGRHGAGITLSLAAGLVVAAGGYLGAHLAIARKVATADGAFASEELPAGT